MKKGALDNKVVVYQAPSGAIEFRSDTKKETLWATQAQIASVFGVNPQAITKHLQNIYNEGELPKRATCSKMELVRLEGKRTVRRNVEIYNLDAIISVGYRISSKMGTRFRQWATKTLRAHIVNGYTINRARIAKNYDKFLEAVESVKKLLPMSGAVSAENALELVKMFANTWFSLNAYDTSALPVSGANRKQARITADELGKALLELRRELVAKKQASHLFGNAQGRDAIAGIVGNVLQSFAGKDLYPTIEEKAAHLLYFIVKNHPFADGNKRSGAFAFIWFLSRAGALDKNKLTPEALTVLTLLVAESNPKDKARVTGLIILLLKR